MRCRAHRRRLRRKRRQLRHHARGRRLGRARFERRSRQLERGGLGLDAQNRRGWQQAPEISATYVTGAGPKTLAEAAGKVVIVDFWGTYCGPCKASFPKYQELLDQFGGDLAIIAISEDDPDDAKESNLKDFVKKTGVKFTILWDKSKAMGKTYNPPNMPTTFIVDKTGKIVSMHAKYENGDEKKIAEEVKALLKK